MTIRISVSSTIVALACAVLAPSAANAWSVTATGTIVDDAYAADSHHGDGMGIFGLADPSSLIGLAYTETITTNPFENGAVLCATSDCIGRRGGSDSALGGAAGAPYTISVTVNGMTFTQAETSPDTNTSELVDALSTGDASSPSLFDSLRQEAFANCSLLGGNCASGFIEASSSSTPFVGSLDFNQVISAGALGSPATGSETYFDYQTPDGTTRTQFWGTVNSLSVNGQPVGVPEPGSFLLMALGVVASVALVNRKRSSLDRQC